MSCLQRTMMLLSLGNSKSEQVKTHGWGTMVQVQAVEQNLAAATRIAPRAALQACLLDESDGAPSLEGIRLCQVQGLKKRAGPPPSFNDGDVLANLNKFVSRLAGANELLSLSRMS